LEIIQVISYAKGIIETQGVKKLKKMLSICFLIIFIAFVSGCVEPDTVPLAENVSSNKSVESVPLAENVSPKGDYAALHIKEIEDIDNGTYFKITDDELKEHPEINKSIRGGEGCTKFDSGGWYCELNSYEVGRYSDFMNRKVYKAGYIEYQFVKIGEYYYEIQLVVS